MVGAIFIELIVKQSRSCEPNREIRLKELQKTKRNGKYLGQRQIKLSTLTPVQRGILDQRYHYRMR